jgi:hypothetical protein
VSDPPGAKALGEDFIDTGVGTRAGREGTSVTSTPRTTLGSSRSLQMLPARERAADGQPPARRP